MQKQEELEEYHNWDEKEHPFTPIATWFTRIQLLIYLILIILAFYHYFNS